MVNVPRQVSTHVGKPESGHRNGTKSNASFRFPTSVQLNSKGDLVVCDQGNNLIRILSRQGFVEIVAGNGVSGYVDGPGHLSEFNMPIHIAIDTNDDIIVADYGNRVIRRIDAVVRNVRTICGSGSSMSASSGALEQRLLGPSGVAVQPGTRDIFLSDKDSGRILRLRGDTVQTISQANWFFYPVALAVDASGVVVVCDAGQYSVFRLAPDYSSVELLVGCGSLGDSDGLGAEAAFDFPCSVCRGPDDVIFLSDFNNHTVRRISSGLQVETVAGRSRAGYCDWVGRNAAFRNPYGLVFDSEQSRLLVADFGNHCVRAINLVGEPPAAQLKQSESERSPSAAPKRGRRCKGQQTQCVLDTIDSQRRHRKIHNELQKIEFDNTVRELRNKHDVSG